MNQTYTDFRGVSWEFNDSVIVAFCPGTVEERSGRLVQVRQGIGAFGSNLYFIRHKNGSLGTFENSMLKAFNGDLPDPIDAPNTEYTIQLHYPETGFVIENPKQPPSEKQSFTMAVTPAGITIYP